MFEGITVKRWRLRLISMLVLAALALLPASGITGYAVAPPKVNAAPMTAGPEEFSAYTAYKHVEELSGVIGRRVAGTESEKPARDYIVNMFKSYGYQVELQEFYFPYYLDRGSSLALVSPQSKQFKAITTMYSRGGSVSGPLADAILARSMDFNGRTWGGKIALASRGEITFNEKMKNAFLAGADGLVIYNNQPGPLRGAFTDISSLPTATISDQDGRELLETVQQGDAVANLSVDTVAEDRLSYNIIARWPGNTPTKAIICAHYDSVREGPGANDNASGVAAVLEAARTMAGIPGVTFIAFGAEEPGLFGSQYYVNRMSALAVDDLWAVVNLDMVGWPGGTLKMEKYGWQSQRFQSRALATAASLGIIAEGGLSTGGSDHVPFANRGIAELHFWTGMDPDHHGPGDTVDKVDATTIANAGRIAVALAWQLVNDLPPPAAP